MTFFVERRFTYVRGWSASSQAWMEVTQFQFEQKPARV